MRGRRAQLCRRLALTVGLIVFQCFLPTTEYRAHRIGSYDTRPAVLTVSAARPAAGIDAWPSVVVGDALDRRRLAYPLCTGWRRPGGSRRIRVTRTRAGRVYDITARAEEVAAKPSAGQPGERRAPCCVTVGLTTTRREISCPVSPEETFTSTAHESRRRNPDHLSGAQRPLVRGPDPAGPGGGR